MGMIRKAFSTDEFFCDSTVISLFTNATSQIRDEKILEFRITGFA